MILDITAVMDRLKEKRRVFASEADFQLEFAWVIKELYPDYDVRLEYCPSFDRRMHIDVLVLTDKRWIPIELKYKTKGCTIIDGTERFILANHSAKDVNCYSYLKDLQRIEQIRAKTDSFAEGYAVMLTNEPAYLKQPARVNCIYTEYSLHEGAEKFGTMCWGKNASAGTIRGKEEPITLEGRYLIHWESFSEINESPSGRFFYIVNSVNRVK